MKYFFQKHKNFLQFAYAVFLIVTIPLLIIFNTVIITDRYCDSLEISLQQRALSVARTIASLVKADLSWEFFIQHRLDELSNNNVGLSSVSVLRVSEDGGFKVVASSMDSALNKVVYNEFYNNAWKSPVYSGLATDSINFNETAGINNKADQGRIWLTAMPISDDTDKKQALLVLELSASMIDELTAQNRLVTVFVVTLTVFLVILFLSVIFRLWDYALLYKKIKEIDELKDEFVSMASHELRAPVTALKGFAEILYNGEMGPVNEGTKDCLGMMRSAAERLGGLVDDLLDVSRIEQKRVVHQPVKMSPDKVIKEVVELFTLQAEEKNLNLNYHPHKDELPEILIDPNRFKQIMTNLVSNAIKYSRKRDGDIQIFTRTLYGNQVLEIAVRDSGIGMSDEEKKNIFEKFYRAYNKKAGKVPGTGLGLWITKQLVEMMDGKIIVESIEDIGSQFTLRFPVAH